LRKFQEKQAKKDAMKAPKEKESKKKPEKQEDPLPEFVNETPIGEKKILKSLDDPLYKAYIPKVVESAWVDWWRKQGFFEPKFDSNGKVSEKGYFVIPIPPPNVCFVVRSSVPYLVKLLNTLSTTKIS
jgi:valyl-tRNA synthetase